MAQTSSRSYYWCRTSIHHEHGDEYWDGGQCVWIIAGTGGEVQPLSRDWRLREVLLNWLGVSPLETEDTGGRKMGTIRTDIAERFCSGHPDAKPLSDPEPPVEVQMSLKQSQQRDMALVAHVLSTGLKNLEKWNESGFRPPLCTYRLNWARRTSRGWWDDWDDTVLQTQDSKFEPGRARYLSVTEAPHNTNFHTWMGKKQFCFFQTAETGNRTPDSGVKGSGANHYPRAPAQKKKKI